MQGWTMPGARLTIGSIVALLCGVLLFASLAMAANESAPIPVDAKGLPLWEIAVWNDFPIEMELENHAALDQLLDDVPLASFNREQVTLQFDTPKSFYLIFEPRVTEAEARALTNAGYTFTKVVDEEKMWRQDMERVWAEQAAAGGIEFEKGTRGYYPTHAQLETLFNDLATANPAIARTFTWGSSVDGRDLLGIVISADVNNTTAEPEVRLSAQMHGDEPSSMVMVVNFAEYLVANYGRPGFDDVTYLVDNYEIHVMPMHNPDGYVAHQRYNSNGVDLNRNFPEPAGTQTTDVENINFMNYANSHNFVISQNGHSGALVVNYPWDYTYTLAPDNDALIKLSLEYSTYNLPMYNGSFPQGITNGAAWYVTTGCVQDWSYAITGCIDVTVEVSDSKWPDASTLDGFWDDNRESLMHFVKSARYGVNGVVTGSDTGLPLDATVTVLGNVMTKDTDPVHGDYYKLLDSGTYDLTFSAYGYIDQTIYGVSTTWGTPTVLDVVMDPVAHGDVSGFVTTLGGAGLSAQVSVFSHPGGDYITTVATDAGDGAYTSHLVYGDYRLDALKNGYITQSALVTISGTPASQSFSLPMAEEVVVFNDDFESGMGLWSGWGISSPATGYNSTNSMNDSPGTVYPNSANVVSEILMGLDLSSAMSGELEFYAKWEIENTWDACFLEVSTNGGGLWTPVATQYTAAASGQGGQLPGGAPCFDDSMANWVLNTVSLTPYMGSSDVLFRFRMSSDTSIQKSGFFVDDFKVTIIREQQSTPAHSVPVLVAGVSAFPNPFNPQTTVKFTNPAAGNVKVGVYDIHGRMIRSLVSESMAAGDHNIVWNGQDNTGAQVASGVYFVRMDTGSAQATQKLMMVK
jgi:hypothetical protein